MQNILYMRLLVGAKIWTQIFYSILWPNWELHYYQILSANQNIYIVHTTINNDSTQYVSNVNSTVDADPDENNDSIKFGKVRSL